MIGLEVDPRLANKVNKRKRAELYEKKDEIVCQDASKRVKLTLEQESVQKICLFEKYSHRRFYSFVMNEAKLTAEQSPFPVIASGTIVRKSATGSQPWK